MKNKIISALAAISMAGMTGACAQLQASDVEQVQNQDLAIIPVTFVTEEDDLTFTMELAKSEREQAIGLMNRTELGERSGMVFPFSPPRQASFWMKNTLIPLDVIFLNSYGVVVDVQSMETQIGVQDRNLRIYIHKHLGHCCPYSTNKVKDNKI